MHRGTETSIKVKILPLTDTCMHFLHQCKLLTFRSLRTNFSNFLHYFFAKGTMISSVTAQLSKSKTTYIGWSASKNSMFFIGYHLQALVAPFLVCVCMYKGRMSYMVISVPCSSYSVTRKQIKNRFSTFAFDECEPTFTRRLYYLSLPLIRDNKTFITLTAD